MLQKRFASKGEKTKAVLNQQGGKSWEHMPCLTGPFCLAMMSLVALPVPSLAVAAGGRCRAEGLGVSSPRLLGSAGKALLQQASRVCSHDSQP